MSKISDNGSESGGGTKTIDPNDILAMYQEVMPLIYHNPEGVEISSQINKRLLTFVQYDLYHTLMDDPLPDRSHSRLYMVYEKWGGLGPEGDAPLVSMHPSNNETIDEDFDEAVERSYQAAIARRRAMHPEFREFYYYKIESREYPRIVIGFLRGKNPQSDNDFTHDERSIFDQLTPHILLLYRSALNHGFHSQGFQYFAAFTKLSTKMANDHGLSDTEVKLIPDILFGYTNEEIAERQFISVNTVKTHIGHILKKTGTKNRVDFLSKFFTSPEHVSL
jgi:DNA-binding CsgD family transcriptional regulator